MAESLIDLEGRTFDLCDLGLVRLAARLGGGRLSQVFRGELSDKRAVAVKVARNDLDANMATNFRSEYETLSALHRAAEDLVALKTVRGFAASYFPQLHCFLPDISTYDGKYSIVVLELIDAPKLIDEAIGSEGHVLKEPFGLETASQYAEMLQVLHAAGYTASDRKIDDIYWRAGNPGSLVVLDWNVVGRGQAGIPDDLFRFGVFWYEFLVGKTPHFVDSGAKRIARPNALPGWTELSKGTRSILEKALHSVINKRYQTADELKADLNRQRAGWSMPLGELERDLETDLEPMQRLAVLDMASRRGSSLPGLKEEIEALEEEMSAKRLSDFHTLVGDFVKAGASRGH